MRRLIRWITPEPDDLGVRDGRLAPCPASPNCVSSDAPPGGQRVAPFALAVAPEAAWKVAREVVVALPGAVIVREEPAYLHAECMTRLLGFVDDLELQLRPQQALIAVRSASRLGYGDLGANRRRVEALRAALVLRHAVLGP